MFLFLSPGGQDPTLSNCGHMIKNHQAKAHKQNKIILSSVLLTSHHTSRPVCHQGLSPRLAFKMPVSILTFPLLKLLLSGRFQISLELCRGGKLTMVSMMRRAINPSEPSKSLPERKSRTARFLSGFVWELATPSGKKQQTFSTSNFCLRRLEILPWSIS